MSTDAQVAIVEGVEGFYRYHLIEAPSRNGKALCGAPCMVTAIPLTQWGQKTHLKEKYCAECRGRAQAIGAMP